VEEPGNPSRLLSRRRGRSQPALGRGGQDHLPLHDRQLAAPLFAEPAGRAAKAAHPRRVHGRARHRGQGRQVADLFGQYGRHRRRRRSPPPLQDSRRRSGAVTPDERRKPRMVARQLVGQRRLHHRRRPQAPPWKW
jgi:hypothetical protein